jgi:hypothetical protein
MLLQLGEGVESALEGDVEPAGHMDDRPADLLQAGAKVRAAPEAVIARMPPKLRQIPGRVVVETEHRLQGRQKDSVAIDKVIGAHG